MLKRKRAVVSYAELNDEDFEDILSDPHSTALSNDNYGSRKRRSNRNASPKTTVEIIKKDQKPLPFTKLPSEIRNYIYELALTAPEGLTLVSKFKSSRRTIKRGMLYDAEPWCDYSTDREACRIPKEQRTPLVPSLLAVSKQINAEGAGYLYKNRMVLQDTKALHIFLTAIGPANRLSLNHVAVKDWGRGRGINKAMNFAAMSLLSTCTNLQTFSIDCRLHYFRTAKQLAGQLFRDGFFFFEALGAARGRRDAALDVLQLKECNYWDCYFECSVPPQELQDFKRQFQREFRKILGA